jgi:uncharacterized protein (DUF58 family)
MFFRRPQAKKHRPATGFSNGQLPSEILKKVRRIELKTRRLVNESMAGEYHSVFKGRGMAFAEVREYQAGDDVRIIDWNVTSRMGHPYVKVYDEERELTVMLVVDASSSGEFGTNRRLKGEIAVEISALLAFSAIKNNDRVGLAIFTDRVEKFIPPKKGRDHVLRVIRELLCFRPASQGTDIAAALEYLNRVLRKKSVVFLISDFMALEFDRPMRLTNQRHDLVAMSLTDPREMEMPNVGLIELEDAETGRRALVDTADAGFRKRYGEIAEERRADLKRRLGAMDVDHVDILTDVPYDKPLMNFFRRRTRKMH